MKEILGAIAIVVGAIIAVLKFLEWYLTEGQKGALAKLSLLMWNWLGDPQTSIAGFHFDKGRPQTALLLLSLAAPLPLLAIL